MLFLGAARVVSQPRSHEVPKSSECHDSVRAIRSSFRRPRRGARPWFRTATHSFKVALTRIVRDTAAQQMEGDGLQRGIRLGCDGRNCGARSAVWDGHQCAWPCCQESIPKVGGFLFVQNVLVANFIATVIQIYGACIVFRPLGLACVLADLLTAWREATWARSHQDPRSQKGTIGTMFDVELPCRQK